MTKDAPNDNGSVALILHSENYDRASYALSIALVALSSGLDVHILLTYGGLRRFTKEKIDRIGDETSENIRGNLEQMLQAGIFQPLKLQLTNAKEIGLKVYACPNAMAALNINLPDLVDEVDEVMGIAAFMKIAKSATLSWYI